VAIEAQRPCNEAAKGFLVFGNQDSGHGDRRSPCFISGANDQIFLFEE
jgi:hypothetical protein